MPICLDRPRRATLCLLSAIAAGLLLAGCATQPNEPSSSGARDTGTFPNLNIKPGEAASQLTPGQTMAKQAELRRIQQANAAGRRPPPNDIPLLTRLGLSHGADALKEIQGK